MDLQHFGLTHPPLGKDVTDLWDDGGLADLTERFTWLLQSPGLGLLTGEPGVGKTVALRHLTTSLNPHRFQVIYLAETDFGRVDLYRTFAESMGLKPSYRRAQLWRDIKTHIHDLADSKQLLPLWILDEAQNTTPEQMKMFLTRIGIGAKAVVTGDVTQIDLPRGQKSGLVEARRILADVRGLAFTDFNASDVVRHPLVARIVDAYEKHDAVRPPA